MIKSIDYVQETLYQKEKTKPQTKPSVRKQRSDNDKFVSKDTKRNVQKALKEGSLTYTEPTKLFGITLRDGFYTYIPQNGETVADIKQKFGIKDGVISSLNAMYDDDYCPAQDKKPVIFKLEE